MNLNCCFDSCFKCSSACYSTFHKAARSSPLAYNPFQVASAPSAPTGATTSIRCNPTPYIVPTACNLQRASSAPAASPFFSFAFWRRTYVPFLAFPHPWRRRTASSMLSTPRTGPGVPLASQRTAWRPAPLTFARRIEETGVELQTLLEEEKLSGGQKRGKSARETLRLPPRCAVQCRFCCVWKHGVIVHSGVPLLILANKQDLALAM